MVAPILSSPVHSGQETATIACQNAMIRQSGKARRIMLQPPVGASGSFTRQPLLRPLRRNLGAGRHRRDRLQDLRGDLVWVALRVRTAIFQIALIAVVDERVRHADRSATI